MTAGCKEKKKRIAISTLMEKNNVTVNVAIFGVKYIALLFSCIYDKKVVIAIAYTEKN